MIGCIINCMLLKYFLNLYTRKTLVTFIIKKRDYLNNKTLIIPKKV